MSLEFEEDSPAELSIPYEKMKNVYDKLKLLDYEREFLKMTKIRPIHRLYFMIPTNPGEQFFYFASLSAWLINKIGRSLEMPQESDDPNKIISSILENIRAIGGVIDFTPSRIKAGNGPDVVNVLEFLTDKALSSQNLLWENPVIKIEQKEEEGEDEDEQEVNLDKIEEEMEAYYSSEGEDDLVWVQGSNNNNSNNKRGSAEDSYKNDQKMLKSDTDAELWRLEVERVLPQLKISVKPDAQDWRLRQDQMKVHSKGVTEVREQIVGPLERIVGEATSVNEKVQGREKFLNSKFESLLHDLSESQKKLQDAREKYKIQSNQIGERNKVLSQLNDDLEGIRKNLEERGSIMADGAPVIGMKKSLNQLKSEVADMDVEIGVMEHCILKALLQEQKAYRDNSNF